MSEITAIIPTYNRSRVLKRAIESVLNQTAPPAQLIVVDDGSTDETAELCRSYKSRIHYVRQDNAGASASRNAGIRLAATPWIAFLDSDDYWTALHLERISHAIESTRGRARFYFSDMQFPQKEGGGTLWERISFQINRDFLFTSDATPWMLMARQPTMLQSTVFSKSALDAVGGLQAQYRLMHDSDLFCRMGIGGPACAVGGLGCIQTDDDSSTRLTGIIGSTSRAYWNEQSSLWRGVLHNSHCMHPLYARLVRSNLAASYWRLCRLQQGMRRPIGIWFFLKAALVDPGFVRWIISKHTSDGYDTGIRNDILQLAKKDVIVPAVGS